MLRFDVSDLINGSVVEAAIDGIKVERVLCLSEITADARKLLSGSISGGSLDDVTESDDIDMQFAPAPTTNLNKQIVDMIILSETDISEPNQFGVRIESSMMGGPEGDVMQTIRLFNYDTRFYETIDTNMMTNADSSVDIMATGDLTRFIHPVTGQIIGRVRLNSPGFAGASFEWTADIDKLTFLIE